MRNYSNELGQYANFISLGYFCGIAQDLEQLGLRKTSSPFDWAITSFRGVVKALETRFQGFMEYDNLVQNIRLRECYMDDEYGIVFYHDFSKYMALDTQYDEVRKKYRRRIARFLKQIKKPTLFFRYISNEARDVKGRSRELKWIEANHEHINDVIKAYNPANRIIYIGDECMKSDIIEIHHVNNDEGDCVSRHPIINNYELNEIIARLELPGREKNIERFEKKQEIRDRLGNRCKRKLGELYHKCFAKVIIYDKEYDRFDRFG